MSETEKYNDLDSPSNETGKNQSKVQDDTNVEIKPKPKPPKPEEKPFKEFVLENLIPELSNELNNKGIKPLSIELINGSMPVAGYPCSMIAVELSSGRKFWLAFSKDDITSTKTIALAESGSQPYTLESFLIDEKKTTLALLISRTLQRLNGQKWLGPN